MLKPSYSESHLHEQMSVVLNVLLSLRKETLERSFKQCQALISSDVLPFKSLSFLPSLLLFLALLSKSGDLEEELKTVTNNLKSLEAQAEKVRYHL